MFWYHIAISIKPPTPLATIPDGIMCISTIHKLRECWTVLFFCRCIVTRCRFRAEKPQTTNSVHISSAHTWPAHECSGNCIQSTRVRMRFGYSIHNSTHSRGRSITGRAVDCARALTLVVCNVNIAMPMSKHNHWPISNRPVTTPNCTLHSIESATYVIEFDRIYRTWLRQSTRKTERCAAFNCEIPFAFTHSMQSECLLSAQWILYQLKESAGKCIWRRMKFSF